MNSPLHVYVDKQDLASANSNHHKLSKWHGLPDYFQIHQSNATSHFVQSSADQFYPFICPDNLLIILCTKMDRQNTKHLMINFKTD